MQQDPGRFFVNQYNWLHLNQSSLQKPPVDQDHAICCQNGRLTVGASLTPLIFSRLAGVLAALWLCGAGSAWAGDGGDLASLQAIIGQPDGSTGLCAILGMKPCPQLPTVTQGILEVAGLGNSPPEIVGAQNSIAPGSNVIAGNPAAVPPCGVSVIPFPLDATTSPKLFGATTILCGQTTQIVPGLLTTLTPLAFTSQSGNGRGDPALRS